MHACMQSKGSWIWDPPSNFLPRIVKKLGRIWKGLTVWEHVGKVTFSAGPFVLDKIDMDAYGKKKCMHHVHVKHSPHACMHFNDQCRNIRQWSHWGFTTPRASRQSILRTIKHRGRGILHALYICHCPKDQICIIKNILHVSSENISLHAWGPGRRHHSLGSSQLPLCALCGSNFQDRSPRTHHHWSGVLWSCCSPTPIARCFRS